MFRCIKLTAGAVLLAAVTAGGAVVNIDFQFLGGATTENAGTVIPSPGTFWNTNTGSGTRPAIPLLTSLGAATGLELTTSVYNGTYNPDGSGVYHDFVTGSATISGLNVGQDYHIVLYGASNIQNNFRIAQPFDRTSPVVSGLACEFGHTAMPGIEGCDWIQGMATADAAGEIRFDVFPGAMSGMQLALNPEPSILMLNALAGLGAALRRRR